MKTKLLILGIELFFMCKCVGEESFLILFSILLINSNMLFSVATRRKKLSPNCRKHWISLGNWV